MPTGSAGSGKTYVLNEFIRSGVAQGYGWLSLKS